MNEIVSSEAHKPPTERRTGQGRRLLIVFTAAMTVAAPLLLPMTAYYLNLLMQASTYAIAVLGLLECQCTNNSFDSDTRPLASGHGKGFVLPIIGFEHRSEATTRDIQEADIGRSPLNESGNQVRIV